MVNHNNISTLTALRSHVQEFIIDRQASGCSPRTIEAYRVQLRYFLDWLPGSVVTVTDITPDTIRRYQLYLQSGHNAGGQHLAYRVIKTFLRWYEAEYMPSAWSNPMSRIKPPRLTNTPLPPVSVAVLQQLLGTCVRAAFTGQRDRALLLALFDSGCRISEFLAWNVNDVNLDTGMVIVRLGKGRKQRVVFLGNKARRELLRYLRLRAPLADDAPVWIARNGERLQRRGVQAMLRRRAARLGIEPPSLHSFRRAFAIESLRAGMDVFALQKLMGHSDLSVLRRYLDQTTTDLAAAHRRAGPVDKLL